MPESPVVSMQAVNKWFGELQVLKDINLTVDSGERVVICGPSGSGKSTLIRCLCELENHQQGVSLSRARPYPAARSDHPANAAKLAWYSSNSIYSRT